METPLEYRLLNSHKVEMITHMKSFPKDFKELIKLSVTDKQPYSSKAAWLLWSCMNKNDQRLHRYVKKIIDIIPNRADNHQRELLMILQRMQIKENYERQLFDSCMKIWKRIDKNPSLRWNAFKILIGISKKHPGLSKEIKSLTESRYTDALSDSVRQSIFKMADAYSPQPFPDRSLPL